VAVTVAFQPDICVTGPAGVAGDLTAAVLPAAVLAGAVLPAGLVLAGAVFFEPGLVTSATSASFIAMFLGAAAKKVL